MCLFTVENNLPLEAVSIVQLLNNKHILKGI